MVQDFIKDGFLTLTAAPRPANQPMIYRDCMDNHYDKVNWMAFIDVDEYIHMRRCAPAPPNCCLNPSPLKAEILISRCT